MRTIRSVCVFCGSRDGSDPAFLRAASELGAAIALRGHTLVYGGARVGLMGAVANGALGAGGRVVGVIPRSLVTKEIAHDALNELFLTDSMHERKNRMLELSDAFVALPGGFGTYDELFEVLTLAQIGYHDKPLGLLDVNRFFDPLVALLRHAIDVELAAPEHQGLWLLRSDPGELLDGLEQWAPPPHGSRFLDRRGAP